MKEGLRDRAECKACEGWPTESMVHIMFDCVAYGREWVWELLEDLWSLTDILFPPLLWGSTFGVTCAIFMMDGGARRMSIEQLWCILCTEALHLIWKLHCERVIQKDGEEFTEHSVTNQFYAAMEARLTLDRRTAAIAKGKKVLQPDDVARI